MTEALRRLGVDLVTLMNLLPDAVVIANPEGRIVVFNAWAERLFRTDQEAMIGQRVEVLVPARFRETHRLHVDSFDASTDTRPLHNRPGVELVAVRSDGTEFSAEIALGPIDTDRGIYTGVVVRDVSWRKELERVALAAEAREQFFASVSHELRTPLTSIIGYCEILDDLDFVTGDALRFIHTIGKNAQRERQLVEDLLFWTSVEESDRRPRPVLTDLSAVVAAVVVGDAKLAQDAQIEIVVTPAEHQVLGLVEAGRMGRALENLLSNAIKFSEPGGAVRIRLTPTVTSTEIRFIDSGPGIPASELGKVFDPLYRGEFARTHEVQGAGLGLAITRRIVESVGGSVDHEPRDGAGSCLLVRLPTQPTPGEGSSRRPRIPPQARTGEARRQGL
ncbi:MAG: ATP-binding protein [Aeromicrobium sp.]